MEVIIYLSRILLLFFNLAVCYEKCEDYDKAIFYYDKVIILLIIFSH